MTWVRRHASRRLWVPARQPAKRSLRDVRIHSQFRRARSMSSTSAGSTSTEPRRPPRALARNSSRARPPELQRTRHCSPPAPRACRRPPRLEVPRARRSPSVTTQGIRRAEVRAARAAPEASELLHRWQSRRRTERSPDRRATIASVSGVPPSSSVSSQLGASSARNRAARGRSRYASTESAKCVMPHSNATEGELVPVAGQSVPVP